MRSTRCFVFVGALLLGAVASADELQGLSPWDRKKVEHFRRLSESSAPFWDHKTIKAFTELRGPFVLPGILKAYRDGRTRYSVELRGMLASALGRRGALSEAELELVRAFARDMSTVPEHGWALFQSQKLLAAYPEERTALRRVVSSDVQAWRKIAALRALTASKKPDWILDLDPWLSSALKSRDPHRELLLCALAWSVAELAAPKQAGGPPQIDRELLALIEELRADARLSRRTRLHIGYALDHAHGRHRAIDSKEAERSVEKRGRFMSVEADGERMVFVLDISESMKKVLSKEERQAFIALLTPEQRRAEFSLIRGMHNRFDAARVHLTLALRDLQPHQSFALLTFCDDAKMWPATPGFVKASEANLSRVLESVKRELPQLGTLTRDRDSELQGKTNLYAALQLAFRVGPRGPVSTPRPELHPDLALDGADMIFLLSDGVPIIDGLAGSSPELDFVSHVYVEPREKIGETEEQVIERRDPETNEVIETLRVRLPIYKGGKTKKITGRNPISFPYGPFVTPKYYPSANEAFADEIRRLNFFRRVIIHTFAFGEADLGLMKSLAAQEHGRAVRVYREPLKPAPGRRR